MFPLDKLFTLHFHILCNSQIKSFHLVHNSGCTMNEWFAGRWKINDRKLLFGWLKFHCYLSAYLKVFRVCSHEPELGDMHDIITVRESPTNESLRTSVNLLPLNGMCPWSLSRALMHSFKASKLLLISAPSILHSIYNLEHPTKQTNLLRTKKMKIRDIISIIIKNLRRTLSVCHYLWYLLHVHFQQDL